MMKEEVQQNQNHFNCLMNWVISWCYQRTCFLKNLSGKRSVFTHSNWQIIILFPLLRDNQMTRLCLWCLPQVCPSIGLQLVTRILCNFTPDEFCPDPVPSTVLEELNSEVCFILTKCCRLLASHTFIHRNVVVKKYLMLCRACWSDAPTKMCSAHFHALLLLLCTGHLRHQMRQRKWQT